MSGWTLPLSGFFLALALLGLVLSLRGKNRDVIKGKPWNDPRSSQHRDFTVGHGDAK